MFVTTKYNVQIYKVADKYTKQSNGLSKFLAKLSALTTNYGKSLQVLTTTIDEPEYLEDFQIDENVENKMSNIT